MFRSGCPAALSAVAVLVLSASSAGAGSSDLSRFDLLPSSPGVVGGALGGIVNPAGFAVPNGGELAFWWNDVQEPGFDPQRWGLAAGSNFSFAVESSRAWSNAPRVYDYQVALSESRLQSDTIRRPRRARKS